MDLKAINATLKTSTEIEIVHPVTGEGGWFIELATPCHTAAQAKAAAVRDKMERRKHTATPAQEQRELAELLCAFILGWRGLASDGEEVPYSHETALQALGESNAFWVRKQILDAIGDPVRPFNV